MFSKTQQRRNIISVLLSCLMAALSRIRPSWNHFKAFLNFFSSLKCFKKLFQCSGTGRIFDFLFFCFCLARFSSLDEENTQFCCENIAAHLEHTLEWEREMVIKRQQEVRSV